MTSPMPALILPSLTEFQSIYDSQLLELIECLDLFSRNHLQIYEITKRIFDTLNSGGTIFSAGNGGSAAASQHLTAELVVRFQKARRPLSSISLNSDVSLLTAVSNDFSFDHIFSRQLEALAKDNDLFIAFSTSGTSPNIVKAIEYCTDNRISVVLITTRRCPDAFSPCLKLAVPTTLTSRGQELHEFIIHLLCYLVEQSL